MVQAFVPVTRFDVRQGGNMGWKGTAWASVVQCAGCGVLYGFTGPHPHREPEWQRLATQSETGLLVKA